MIAIQFNNAHYEDYSLALYMVRFDGQTLKVIDRRDHREVAAYKASTVASWSIN